MRKTGIKNTIVVSVAVCNLVFTNFCNAEYIEEGKLKDLKSWETPEYKKYWGLGKINSSVAYALGYTGQNIILGIVDSGVLLSHPEFSGNRVSAVDINGYYFMDGMRYPDAKVGNTDVAKNKDNNEIFSKGQNFSTSGSWIRGVNDSHGTHVGGTIAANRDGLEMHGVAWGAKLISANTGGSDGMTYGPTQDYNYFSMVYQSLAKNGVRVINNSWGANRKVNSSFEGALGFSIGGEISPAQPQNFLYIKDLDNAKKAYYQFIKLGYKTWLDAAYEVAENNGVIQVFTAGNRNGMEESYTRAMLPYFRPDIEKLWVNVTGSTSNDAQLFNMPGHSKWWSIAAPSEKIISSTVNTDGIAGYDEWQGTSMAAPHVTGALGVIMSRYPYMSNSQVREVMLTTARQTRDSFGTSSSDRRLISGFSELGVPNEKWGWGILDLGKAMFGPGQFLGTFNVLMNRDDVWSNNISDVAIKARKIEDESDNAVWTSRKNELENKNTTIGLSQEEKIEYTIELAREKARKERMAQGYKGSLIKNGSGTLTLAGANTYTGDTVINQGKIVALNQALSNSKVIVNNGGAIEMVKELKVESVNKGRFSTSLQVSKRVSDSSFVDIEIRDGGKLFLSGLGANNLNVTFKEGSLIGVSATASELRSAFKNPAIVKTYSATGNFIDYSKANLENYAFFDLIDSFTDSELKIELRKNSNTMTSIARTKNEELIAKMIENSSNNTAIRTAFRSASSIVESSDVYNSMLFATPKQAKDTLRTFANEANFVAQNASIINNVLLKNSIIDYKNSSDAIREDKNGITFWTSTIANRLSYANLEHKSQTYGQTFGINGQANDNTKIGGIFGITKTNTYFEGNDEYKSVNSHFGIYANTALENITLNSGVIYTNNNRRKAGTSVIVDQVSFENFKSKEKISMVFADIGYKNIVIQNLTLKPYMGLSYINSKVDASEQKIGSYTMVTDKDSRDMALVTLGVSNVLPFNILSKNFTASSNISYNRFFGQRSPDATVGLAGAGVINLKGEEIKDLGVIDAGIETKIFQNATLKLSYNGVFGSHIRSNGVNIKFGWSF